MNLETKKSTADSLTRSEADGFERHSCSCIRNRAAAADPVTEQPVAKSNSQTTQLLWPAPPHPPPWPRLLMWWSFTENIVDLEEKGKNPCFLTFLAKKKLRSTPQRISLQYFKQGVQTVGAVLVVFQKTNHSDGPGAVFPWGHIHPVQEGIHGVRIRPLKTLILPSGARKVALGRKPPHGVRVRPPTQENRSTACSHPSFFPRVKNA